MKNESKVNGINNIIYYCIKSMIGYEHEDFYIKEWLSYTVKRQKKLIEKAIFNWKIYNCKDTSQN